MTFLSSLRKTLHYWPVLAILYLANLFSALGLAALPAAGLLSQAREGYFQQAARGLDLNTIPEFLLEGPTQQSLGLKSGIAPEFLAFLVGIIELIGVAPLLAWLPAAFLYGGTLLIYAEAPHRFELKRYIWGCWHWWGAFLLLGLVQGVGWLVFFGGMLIAVGWLTSAVGGWVGWAYLPVGSVLLVLWLAVIELARASMVRIATRNPLRGAWEAVRLLLRHPLDYAGIYAAWLGIWLAVQLLFRLALLPNLPLAFWPLVLFVQQAFVLLRLWARAGRLAAILSVAS